MTEYEPEELKIGDLVQCGRTIMRIVKIRKNGSDSKYSWYYYGRGLKMTNQWRDIRKRRWETVDLIGTGSCTRLEIKDIIDEKFRQFFV